MKFYVTTSAGRADAASNLVAVLDASKDNDHQEEPRGLCVGEKKKAGISRRRHLLSELEGLVDHHHDACAFTGASHINPYHQPFAHGPEPYTGVPFHGRVQFVEIPRRGHTSGFDKGNQLNPSDSNVLLKPGPVVEWVPFGDHAILRSVVHAGLVAEALVRKAARVQCPIWKEVLLWLWP